MNSDVFAEIETRDKNLMFSTTHRFSECNSRNDFFNIFQSTLVPLLHLDGVFIVRFNEQSGHYQISGSSEIVNTFSPSLGTLINQIIINNNAKYQTSPGIAISTAKDIQTQQIIENTINNWATLKNYFEIIAGIFDTPSPSIGLWVYRKEGNRNIFNHREINILKYMRPFLLQVIKNFTFQEEKAKYSEIAEYFITSNEPQAVIKSDCNILLSNKKFTDQITQFNNIALPSRLHQQVVNLISEQSHNSKDSQNISTPLYFRHNRRLYDINISPITSSSQISNSIWLLTLNRISDIESKLCRTLTDANITQRETEIIHLLQTGISSADVANNLEISYHTTRTHVRNIYKKLGVSSSRELLTFLHQPNL